MDDLGAVSVRRSFPRVLGSVEPIFDFLREFFDGQEIPDDDRFGVEVAVEELFSNVVRHQPGGDPEVHLAIERRGSELRVTLTDSGVPPFDIRSLPEVRTDLPLEQRRPGGLGIHFVKKLMDRIDYSYDGGRSTTVITRTIKGTR